MQTIKARDLTDAYIGLTVTHMPPPPLDQARPPIVITGTLNAVNQLAVRDLTNEGKKDNGVIITIDNDKYLLLPNQTVDFPDLAPTAMELLTGSSTLTPTPETATLADLTPGRILALRRTHPGGFQRTEFYSVDGPSIPADDLHTPPHRTASRTGFAISTSAVLLTVALSLKIAFNDPTLTQHLTAITGIACAGILAFRLIHVGRRATHWTN